MSKFSGKSDFYCHVFMSSKPLTDEELFEKFKGTKLYIARPLPDDFSFEKAREENISIPETYYKKIEYSSIKDLVPYYPHLVSMAVCDNTDSHKSVVILTSQSYVDMEEQKLLDLYLKDVLKNYNRCKRKKTEFTLEGVLNEFCYNEWRKDIYVELYQRVKESGKKATTEHLHLSSFEHYRKKLVEEMMKYNIDPAEYGYDRFVK